jgi:DNA-binding CsgD family transcriptional regulator/tetratricopeptide (TPR) repeat protein
MAFVGREPELARLAGALERAARGERSRVVLVGGAGVGLSRLLDEVTARLEGLPGLTLVRGAAHEPLSGEPYAPVAAALRSSLREVPDDRLPVIVGRAAQILSPLLPEVSERLATLGQGPPPAPIISAADQAAGRFSEAVVAVLERLAGEGTILLVFEDLHWADPGTRRFVETLWRIGRPARLCLVLSYRPEELHLRHPARPLIEVIEADRDAEQIEVGALERREIARLLEGLIGEPPSAALVAATVEGSAGIPLLVEQLAAARLAGSHVRLSEPFEEILRARLEPLSVAAVRCLRLLAAARRPLPAGLVRRIDLPDGRLPAEALDEAVASGLAIVVDPSVVTGPATAARSGKLTAKRRPAGSGLRPNQLIGIRHDRYAEALDGLGLPADRQAIHAALARALTGHPAEQAWQLESAMRFAAARNAHLEAGLAAEVIEPGETTLLHFQRALELVDAREARVPSLGMPVPRLLGRAAEAAFAAGHAHRAAALISQAISESTATSSVERAGRVAAQRRALEGEVGLLYVRLGQFRSAAGDLAGALAALESAVEVVPVDRTAERAHVFAVLAQLLMLDGRFEQSGRAARRARDLASRAGEVANEDLGSAACTLGVDLGYLGDVDGGLALLDEAIALGDRSRRLEDLMRAYANRTHLLELDARLEAALAAVQDGIRAAREWGAEAAYGAFLRGNAADIMTKLGRWSEAEAETRAALEWSPERFVWSPLLALGGILVESRADEEASRVVGQILLQLEEAGEGQWAAAVQRIAVSDALWRDDPADAVRVARRGWDQVKETPDWRQVAWAASTTAEAAAALADTARTRRDLVTVAAMSELSGAVAAEAGRQLEGADPSWSRSTALEARLHVATARAHLDRCRGQHDPRAWQEIADGWLDIRVPYLAAKARWWQAEACLQSTSDRVVARESITASWALARDLPARPLLRELARLARRARISLPEGADEELLMSTPGSSLVAVGPGVPAGHRGAGVPDVAGDGDAGGLLGLNERLTRPREAVRDPFNLSPRELEVLALIVQGGSNRDIAQRLFISERTVGVHVRNILAKLGVAGRIEAANVAIRLGLVPVPAAVRLVPTG